MRLSTSFTGIAWKDANPMGNGTRVSGIAGFSMALAGKKIFLGDNGKRLWLSSDYGNTWSEVRPAGDADKGWRASNMSEDGQTLVAAINGGRAYISTDGGANWSETQPGGAADIAWIDCDISDDGQVIIMCASPTSHVYITTNQGGSWTAYDPPGATANWAGCGVSGDGNVFLAGADGGALWAKTGAGAWSSAASPATTSWNHCRLNYDGSKRIAGSYTRIYIYENSAWSETKPIGANNGNWRSSNVSRSGNTFICQFDNSGTYGVYIRFNKSWQRVYPSKSPGAQTWSECDISSNDKMFVCSSRTDLADPSGHGWVGTISSRIGMGESIRPRAFGPGLAR